MSEESGLERFSKTALNYGKTGAKEHIVSGLLVRANLSSDGVKKVKLLCEATRLTEDKKHEIDRELVQTLYIVACSLDTAVKDKTFNAISIPWGFEWTEGNFNKYIGTWHHIKLTYFLILIPDGRKLLSNQLRSDDRHRYEKEVRKKFSELQRHEKFFIATDGALAESSFISLKNEFVQYAMQTLMPIEMFVAEKVSPNVYRNAFAEIFKHSTDKGEGDNEDIMDTRE
jgi:hypothetical protein